MRTGRRSGREIRCSPSTAVPGTSPRSRISTTADEEEYNRGACLRVLDRLPDDEVDVWNVLYFRNGMKLELAESDWLTYRQALDAKHRVEREIGSENACAELVRVSR